MKCNKLLNDIFVLLFTLPTLGTRTIPAITYLITHNLYVSFLPFLVLCGSQEFCDLFVFGSPTLHRFNEIYTCSVLCRLYVLCKSGKSPV